MTKTTSLYLEIIRLLAALAVFFLHSTFQGVTGGFLWQLGIFGDDAVMAFFVLSGCVIVFCAERKHDSFSDYMIARLSRLWSVAIPALLLTYIVDLIRWHIESRFARFGTEFSGLSFMLSALFVNQVWFLKLAPGCNYPFWSISYEFIYYLCLGFAFYLPRNWRWVAATAVLIAGGPKIALLLPIWLLGVFAYYVGKRHPAQLTGWIWWLGSLVGFAAYYGFGKQWITIHVSPAELMHNGVFTYADLATRYLFSIMVFFNIIGFQVIGQNFGWLLGYERVIRNLAKYSFSLYLYHFPLLFFFRTATEKGHGQWWSIAIIYGGTLSIIAILAPLTEWRKNIVANRLVRLKEWCMNLQKDEALPDKI